MIQTPPEAGDYAGLVTRGVALLIDVVAIDAIALVAGAVVAAIASALGARAEVSVVEAVLGGAAWVVWSGAYFVGFWSLAGQTPGNRLLGIRVTAGHRRMRAGRAALRFGALVLAALPLGAGFVPVLFDDQRRGLHDRIAGTTVRWDRGDLAAPGGIGVGR